MRCEDVKEWLLSFYADNTGRTMPDEISFHLKMCRECARQKDVLELYVGLKADFQGNADSGLKKGIIWDKINDELEKGVFPVRTDISHNIFNKRVMAVAASFIFLLSFVFYSYFYVPHVAESYLLDVFSSKVALENSCVEYENVL